MVLRQELSNRISAAEAAFKSWATMRYKELEQSSKVTTPVYHYTTAAGLQGILNDQCFFGTSVYHLNDPSELSHGIALVRATLSDLKNDPDDWIQAIAQDLEGELSDDWHKLFGLYPLSFSRTRDDLGQWRAYGDNGRGFCIGLSPSLFSDGAALTPPKHAFVIRLEYEEAVVSDRMMDGAKKAATLCRVAVDDVKLTENEGHEFTKTLINTLATRLSGYLLLNAATAKHQAYKHEAETRLLIFNDKEALAPHVDTRARGDRIIPFIKHHMPLQSKGSIVELLVGPSASAGAEDAVASLLRSVGIADVMPVRSKIPYRS